VSEVLGRHIEAGEAKFDDWAADLPMDGRQKERLGKVYASYADYGSGGNSLALSAIQRREPRSLRGYIEELASAEPTNHSAAPPFAWQRGVAA
jgi:hypothetical protein